MNSSQFFPVKAAGVAVLCVFALAPTTYRASAETFSYTDLVGRLTNLQALATLPTAAERSAQWSSYDRKSQYDAAKGAYVDWDANGDGDGVIRKEGTNFVVAEMQGAGCIWRIWSATPGQGHVKIYLDGAAEPAVDLPFVGYFDRKHEPFTRPSLVHTVARGWNNYTPIPYKKSCRIVAEPKWGAYYHFNYETFPPGTEVPSFRPQLSPDENAALDQVERVLATSGTTAGTGAPAATGECKGATWTGDASLKGPAAISLLRVKIDADGPRANYDALRGVTLQIRWDGEKEPSVWAPLVDFFGTAPGLSAYKSLPLGRDDAGWWYCRWFMPFAREAQIAFRKDGGEPVNIKYEVFTAPVAGDPSRLGRFHAKWHRDALLPSDPARQIDWTVLKTTGAGRFVGMMLHIWNPRGGWWGEGDEKFFVDGEKFPSTIGTGSEDYFGYAWCNPGLFQNAYHSQTHNDGNNKGHVSVNRWHIADNIPFAREFEASIEKYYNNQRPTLYAGMAYWYLAPGGQDPYSAAPFSERAGYWIPIQNQKVAGAVEGEGLKIIKLTGGKTEEQDLTGFSGQWSNDAHLWWTEGKPGSRLEVALPVSTAGNYRLVAQFTKARDYGIAQLYLDGEPLGSPVDFYNAQVIPTGRVVLGEKMLSAGEHKFSAELTGANPKAIKAYMFGLDYLKLEKD